MSLYICADSPEPSLLTDAINYIKISCTGTYMYCNGNQEKLWLACAFTQSLQSLHGSHALSLEVDEDADQY